MNYLLIHRTSNLILKALETDRPVFPNDQYKPISVSELVMDKYHALLSKHSNGTCVDAGEFALISPSFLEALKG